MSETGRSPEEVKREIHDRQQAAKSNEDPYERTDFKALFESMRADAEGKRVKCVDHPDREGVARINRFSESKQGVERVDICAECIQSGNEIEAHRARAALVTSRARDVDQVVAENCGRRYVGKRLSGLRGLRGDFMRRLVQVAEERSSALFWGGNGTGKTHAAVAIYRKHYLSGLCVSFYAAGDLLDGFRRAALETGNLIAEVNRLRAIEILVIDDIGGERVTEFAAEGLFRILDWRDRDGSPTIVTTNLDEDALKDHVGDRTVSRLFGLIGPNLFQFSGSDQREE